MPRKSKNQLTTITLNNKSALTRKTDKEERSEKLSELQSSTKSRQKQISSES